MIAGISIGKVKVILSFFKNFFYTIAILAVLNSKCTLRYFHFIYLTVQLQSIVLALLNL